MRCSSNGEAPRDVCTPRSQGRRYAVLDVRWREGGRNRSRRVYTEEDAKRLDGQKHGEAPAIRAKRRANTTWAEFCFRWIGYLTHEEGLADRTIHRYQVELEAHIIAYGKGQGWSPASVTTPDLRACVNARRDHRDGSPASRAVKQKTATCLRGLMRFAQLDGYRADNPGFVLKTYGPRPRDRRVVIPSLLDVYRWAEACPDVTVQVGSSNVRGSRFHSCLILVCAFGGFRPHEALILRWDVIDRREGQFGRIRVGPTVTEVAGARIPKTSGKTAAATRSVPILAPMSPVLEELKEFRMEGNPYLFPGARRGRLDAGGPLIELPASRDYVARFVKAAAEAADVRYQLRDLRHVAASVLADSGASPMAVKEFMGHDRIQTTWDIYAELWPDDLDDLAVKAGGAAARRLEVEMDQVALNAASAWSEATKRSLRWLDVLSAEIA